jgi:hypothetical protein
MALLLQSECRLLAGLILLFGVVPSTLGGPLPAVSVTRVVTTVGEASGNQQLAKAQAQYSVYRVRNNSLWPVNLELKVALNMAGSSREPVHVYIDENNNGRPDPHEPVVTSVSLDSGEARSLVLRKPAALLIVVAPE